MRTTRLAMLVSGLLASASLAAGLLAWGALPDTMATHWGADGAANGWSGKTFGVFFLPLLSGALAAILFGLPKIDPLSSGFKAFRKEYDGLVTLIVSFLAIVHGAVLAWNLGARFDFVRIVGPGIGLLFFYLGAVMPQMKRNWFAGIRTPWTLSSDRVWDETHRVGGKAFQAAGILAVLGGVFTDHGFALVVAPALAAALGVTIYSYLVYRRR